MKSGASFTLVAVEYMEPQNYRQAGIKAARDNVFELIEQYDQELTKNSQEIIKNHHDLRKYALNTGKMIVNWQVWDAGSEADSDKDVLQKFVGKVSQRNREKWIVDI